MNQFSFIQNTLRVIKSIIDDVTFSSYIVNFYAMCESIIEKHVCSQGHNMSVDICVRKIYLTCHIKYSIPKQNWFLW